MYKLLFCYLHFEPANKLKTIDLNLVLCRTPNLPHTRHNVRSLVCGMRRAQYNAAEHVDDVRHESTERSVFSCRRHFELHKRRTTIIESVHRMNERERDREQQNESTDEVIIFQVNQSNKQLEIAMCNIFFPPSVWLNKREKNRHEN